MRGTVGPYRHFAYDSLASTNDEAMARLRAGDPGGFFVTATSQSGGRGRQGRAWLSPPGNLYASAGLLLDVVPAVAPQLGFVAGVALVTALASRLGGDERLRLKWPNDVIFAGAKLAGILLESTTIAGRIGIVMGFGVNCRSHPGDLPYAATDLVASGDADADAAAVLGSLARDLNRQLSLWDGGRGFEQVRAAWMTHAVALGTRLAVVLPEARLSGTFAGLDPSGRLLIVCGAEQRTVEAGDVFLPELLSG